MLKPKCWSWSSCWCFLEQNYSWTDEQSGIISGSWFWRLLWWDILHSTFWSQNLCLYLKIIIKVSVGKMTTDCSNLFLFFPKSPGRGSTPHTTFKDVSPWTKNTHFSQIHVFSVLWKISQNNIYILILITQNEKCHFTHRSNTEAIYNII